MTWAQRLNRVFAIEIQTCRRCGGTLRAIASIKEPTVIDRPAIVLRGLKIATCVKAHVHTIPDPDQTDSSA